MLSISRYSVIDHFKAIQYVSGEKKIAKTQKILATFIFFCPSTFFLKSEESALS